MRRAFLQLMVSMLRDLHRAGQQHVVLGLQEQLGHAVCQRRRQLHRAMPRRTVGQLERALPIEVCDEIDKCVTGWNDDDGPLPFADGDFWVSDFLPTFGGLQVTESPCRTTPRAARSNVITALSLVLPIEAPRLT